jgi:Protein of unknown function (DUF4054)
LKGAHVIDWTNVTAVAPELATAPAALQAAVLAQVNAELNPAIWGARVDVGRAWLAAHLATLALRKGISGMVTGQTAGPVSLSLSPLILSKTSFALTTYGLEFERQTTLLFGARFAVGEY